MKIRLYALVMIAVLLGQAMVAGGVWSPAPATADSAPMWQSPVGLAPGLPGVKVRMVAEKVDIEVVERENAVLANVRATFLLYNPGAPVQMLVGFPAYSTLSTRIGGIYFDPRSQQTRNFRAVSGAQGYSPTEKRVDGMPWWVWEMGFPAGRTTQLDVSYEQQLADLDREGLARVFYVLTTGALWDGTIGEAVITVTAPQGALVDATPDGGDLSPQRAAWRLRDIKPTEDIGLVYVPDAAWKTLSATEASIQGWSATTADYLAGARTVVGMIKGAYGSFPRIMRENYMPKAVGWATRVAEYDAGNIEAWEIIGTITFTDSQAKHILRCWPTRAEDAFGRAAALGSTTGEQGLKDLAEYREFMVQIGIGIPEPCE
jgi:hypothetical protein